MRQILELNNSFKIILSCQDLSWSPGITVIYIKNKNEKKSLNQKKDKTYAN